MLASQPCFLAFRDPGVAEKRPKGVGLLGPDRAVAGMVSRLWAAGRVAEPDQRPARLGGARQAQAERFRRISEPAVVSWADVQAGGLCAEQVLHSTVGVEH